GNRGGRGLIHPAIPDYAYVWLMESQQRAENTEVKGFPCTDDGRAGATDCFPAVGCSARAANRSLDFRSESAATVGRCQTGEGLLGRWTSPAELLEPQRHQEERRTGLCAP